MGTGGARRADLPLAAAVAGLLVMAVLVGRGATPPAARDAEAPGTDFSAERALAVLARLLGDGAPHPTGSGKNDRVRERVEAELRALGLAPETDTRLVCGGWGRCALVNNVLARIPGSEPGVKAVLLAVHHDSVAAGPGASDDGAGVAAVLEVARAVLAGPPLRRDLLLLVDDGEEQGLLGAESFVQHSPWAVRVGAVVNLEARGTSGPSMLFELSPGNARLVGAAARSLRRPATSSIYYTVYQRLPNDTDLTVFKRAGLPGVNFGFVGDPLRYHTPRDELRLLDPRSLQHHGDNALAMVRVLGDDEGEWSAPDDVVFFDLAGLVVARWPLAWTVPLTALAAVLVMAAAWRLRGRDSGPARAGWAVLAVLALLAGAAGGAWGLLVLLRALGAAPYTWVAHPAPLLAAFWALPIAVVGALAVLLGGRLTARGSWVIVWGLFAVLAVPLAAVEPGVSFPLLAPVLVAGLVGAAGGGRGGAAWLGLPATLLQALLVFPFAWKLLDALGTPALPGIALLVALVLAGVLPALAAAGRGARLALALAGALVMIGGVYAAAFVEPFTVSSPRPLSLVLHHDVDAGAGRWLVATGGGELPPSLARAGGFGPRPIAPYPWASAARAWEAPAAVSAPATPELRDLAVERDGEGLVVRARLLSPRGAPWAGLYLPASRLVAATVDGVVVRYPPGAEARRGDADAWLGIEHATLPPEGAVIELTVSGGEPVELHVWDSGPGVGEAGAPLLAVRPDWAVPIGRGDRTLVTRRVVAGAGDDG